MEKSLDHKQRLRKLNPFAPDPVFVDQVQVQAEQSADAKSIDNLQPLPATLLGLLVSGDGEVTQAWLEQNFQKLQSVIRYLNNDMQFRLLGFVPPKILLALLLDEESAVRKRHFEWCCKHPSSRTARKTIHIKEAINGWLDDYQRRFTISGTESNPNTPTAQSFDDANNDRVRQIKD